MRTWTAWAVAVGASLAAGCGADSGPDGGSGRANDGLGCEEVESRTFALDEATPIGITGRSLADRLGSLGPATLTFEDGATTSLSIALVETDDVVHYVDNEVGDASMEVACPDTLSLGARITLTTADGKFNEALAGALVAAADSSQVPMFRASMPLSSLGGTFEPAPADVAGADSVEVDFELRLTESSHAGSIGMLVSSTEGDTSSGSYGPVASWVAD